MVAIIEIGVEPGLPPFVRCGGKRYRSFGKILLKRSTPGLQSGSCGGGNGSDGFRHAPGDYAPFAHAPGDHAPALHAI